ncbi:MAG: type I methionyl aminopeptidase [Candidatus Sungbacteria bacterium]|nr:type I methionyl aminopeptidase [Candidatus Sungbacteria bacterium]
MISIKTGEEIKVLREGGKRLAGILAEVVEAAKEGVSTLELDRLAESLIFKSGGTPSFKGYRLKETKIPYPGSLCVSVNAEVVHSIPRADKILKEGDVVGLDIGMQYPGKWQKADGKWRDGLFTDMAVTVGIGKISKEAERLIKATKEALDSGIYAVRPGAHVGDIGYAVQKHLEKNKLGIIRDLAGHGVGYEVHEEPFIPNYGKAGQGPELKEGMVLAIEPMATLGDWRVELQDDEWTFRTADGSMSAHFEHTVAVTDKGVEVITLP